MFSTCSMMALLAVLALSAQAAESAIAAPKVCAAEDLGKGFCINCKTKAKCEVANSPPVPKGDCTVAGQACTVLVNVATCKLINTTTCSCNKSAQCDAYDPNSALICLGGGVTVSKNCNATGTGETCENGVCVALTTSTASLSQTCNGKPDGFVVLTPLCTTAEYCSGGTSMGPPTDPCPSGQYWDTDIMGCLGIPPKPCAGCGTGACPDKSDCSKWYICDGVNDPEEETCVGAMPDYDIGSKECVGSGMGKCTGNDNCTYGLTTSAPTTATPVSSSTTTTSRPATCTAANVGQRYPYAGNCKKYWSCRQVATGVYAYVESTCMGDLVFNAATGYCDTLASVPSCALGK